MFFFNDRVYYTKAIDHNFCLKIFDINLYKKVYIKGNIVDNSINFKKIMKKNRLSYHIFKPNRIEEEGKQ